MSQEAVLVRTGRRYRCLTRRGAVKLAAAMKATSLPKVVVLRPALPGESESPMPGPFTYGYLHVFIHGRVQKDESRWPLWLSWRPWFSVHEWWVSNPEESR